MKFRFDTAENEFSEVEISTIFGNFDELAMNKISVNGRKTDPFYKFLKKQKPGIAGTSQIKWNFTKFLVNRSGQVIERFGPQVEASEIEKSIEKNL